MFNKLTKKIMISIGIIFVICFSILINNSYAVSGKPGGTVTVTYSITSPDGSNLTTVTGKLNYDSSLVDCIAISSSAGIAKNDTVSATETQINGTSMTVTATYKIKDGVTKESISTSLVLSELYTKNSDANKAGSPIAANINVELNNDENNPTENTPPPAQKSSDANLSNLGIRPNDFKGFKSGTTSYNVTVPNDVEEVTVYATAKDSKSSISGTGKKKLNVGANALSVVVTAEDGTTKTYTVNVTREEATNETNEVNETNETNEVTNTATDETTENPDTEVKNSDLTELQVTGYNLTPKFSPYIYEYSLDITKQDVTSLDIKTKTKDDKTTVEIVGNTDLKEGENIVTILVHNEVTGDNSTYQIIVNKTNQIDISAVNEALDTNIEKANRVRKIILGVIVFIIVCVIIFVVARYKIKKGYDDDFDEEDDDIDINEDDTIDEETPKALQNNLKLDENNEEDDDENIEDDYKEKSDEIYEENEENTIKDLDDIKPKINKDNIIIEEPEERDEKKYRKSSGKGKHF